jgi:hypothetical protein
MLYYKCFLAHEVHVFLIMCMDIYNILYNMSMHMIKKTCSTYRWNRL